jgi:hypothetical protein
VSSKPESVTQEHIMTSFITQSVARQQIADRIAEAEAGRLRRQVRTFGAESRSVRRSTPGAGSGTSASQVRRFRFAFAR